MEPRVREISILVEEYRQKIKAKGPVRLDFRNDPDVVAAAALVHEKWETECELRQRVCKDDPLESERLILNADFLRSLCPFS
jgi:hypothetical protein